MSTNGPIFVDTGEAAPSEWQQRIEGTWHGRPSIFDSAGNHVGYEKVARASEFKDGRTLYWMDTKFTGGGALRPRLELGGMFAFGVIDSDQDRVYTGPDFYGAGQPYGSFVDSNYYSPAWQADLVTWNHVLPGTDLQVYSSVCYDGWTPALVFNGVYLRTTDHETNPETQARIAAFMAEEERLGDMSFQLPTKARGAWRGEVEVYTPDQKLAGTSEVTVEHEPMPDLLRSSATVTWRGVLDRTYRFDRIRNGRTIQLLGPDYFGNQMSYGRASFVRAHFTQTAEKIVGREFMLDESHRQVVAWQVFDGNALTHVVHGVLDWHPEA
jgi:hypothetical protein